MKKAKETPPSKPTPNDSGKEQFSWEGPSHSRLFYLRDSDLVCDTCDFSMEKNSQELLCNQ